MQTAMTDGGSYLSVESYKDLSSEFRRRLVYCSRLQHYRSLLEQLGGGLLNSSLPHQYIQGLVDMLLAAYQLGQLDRAVSFVADTY